MKILRYCPKCEYYLFLIATYTTAKLSCKNCGFTESFNPASSEEALILETNFRSGSSASGASSGITVNEYTRSDPTLPHVKTIKCVNSACTSQADPTKRDVIYIKTDPHNMKFQYICNAEGCGATWNSA
jgi:DNA-directed RNA polymerase subunit M/transcription elongation factor TFIIS